MSEESIALDLDDTGVARTLPGPVHQQDEVQQVPYRPVRFYEIVPIGAAAAGVEQRDLARRSDVLVSLGGDGTMLRSMRLARGHHAPVLGMNLGRAGIPGRGRCPGTGRRAHRHRRAPLHCRGPVGRPRDVRRRGQHGLQRHRAGPDPGRGSTAAVEVQVEGHSFVRDAADAVVVATPTGSTAYSFSAAGPIVSPNAEGLLVVPVAPHSAFNRALFLSGGEKLVLEVLPVSGELAVEADGRVVGHVLAGDVVDLTLLPAAAHVVRLGHTTFYQRAPRRLRLTGSAEVD